MATPRRLQRIANVIHRRQADLAVALDSVHDPHNLAAVLRTCDAVGVSSVFWQPDVDDPDPPNPEVAMGAERWVQVKVVPDLPAALRKIKERGFRIAATHLGHAAVDFREPDWTEPWVVVMGNERRGCSEDVLALADLNIKLPMAGFVQSLNVSVATAIVLYEIQRQREAAGRYARRATKRQFRDLHRRWGLKEDGIPVEDLIACAPGQSGEEADSHIDGRTIFRTQLIARRRRGETT